MTLTIQEERNLILKKKIEELEQTFQQARAMKRSLKDGEAMIRALEHKIDRLHSDIMRLNSGIFPDDDFQSDHYDDDWQYYPLEH